MIVADARLHLVSSNDAARLLFPGARPGTPLSGAVPAWIASAHARRVGAEPPAMRPPEPQTGPARGPIGPRSYEAHPTAREDGTVEWWLVDETHHRTTREELRTERERTAFLVRSSNLLLSSLNLDRCMEATAQLAAEHFTDAALVLAPDHGGGLRVVSCVRGGHPCTALLAVDPGEAPGLAEALQGFPPVPSRWLDPAVAPDWLLPDGLARVGSIVVTPLPGHGVPAGALVLLRTAGGAPFSEDEEVFARLFAARAGAAMSAARLYADQAAVTDTLMRELLPPKLRQTSGVEYAGGYRPSKDHERVGGDFYDLHPMGGRDEASLVVLGDVCGKGLEAAVMTGKIRNTLQALLPMADDHHRVLSLLNSSLLKSDSTRFATMVLASAAREGNAVRLRLTSAGHPAPLVLRVDGSIEEAPTRGTLVGALPEITTETASVTLAPGDACVLYTDGISEARGGPLGGAMFGEERLRRALSECAAMPAEAVVERVQMLAAQWIGAGRHDDMAVVVISAPRTNHLSAVDGHTRGRFTA
ncbi:PP2C family protein-serine/threonine phosphatase [Streptomyces sp. NPDC059917]|uniref:PP2C family protein-serine/threonine phosphatase n=1 Tax=Streptomyces sp. NPDC059917 TaxID=3347002 RepID=UPI003667F0F2